MQILNNPITKGIANALSNVKPGGPLDDVLEFIGFTNPEKLGEIVTADSLGDVTEAMFDAYGYEPEISAALGVATDAVNGNVQGAVSNAAEEVGGEDAASAVELAGKLPV